MTVDTRPYDRNTDNVTDEYICEVVDYLVNAVDPAMVILFGSRARGDHRPWSDIDLLIVDPNSTDEVNERYRMASRLRSGLPYRIGCEPNFHICSPSRLEWAKGAKNHLLGRAQREGVVLYRRQAPSTNSP